MLTFSTAVCFVGSNRTYSSAAIRVLIRRKIRVAAIVGETASSVWNELVAELEQPDPLILSSRRPWEEVKALSGSVGINCGFDYIIPEDVLQKFPIINLHPSALPLNRGCHHSFWGIMEKTPLGATMHWMDASIDGGPIIAQKTFQDDGVMTAAQIQTRSDDLCLALLDENIEQIMLGNAKSVQQRGGTYHSRSEIVAASTINYSDSIEVARLFDLCRATCNKGNGFIVSRETRRFLVKIASIEELE